MFQNLHTLICWDQFYLTFAKLAWSYQLSDKICITYYIFKPVSSDILQNSHHHIRYYFSISPNRNWNGRYHATSYLVSLWCTGPLLLREMKSLAPGRWGTNFKSILIILDRWMDMELLIQKIAAWALTVKLLLKIYSWMPQNPIH